MANHLLHISALQTFYGDVQVLRDINLFIKTGEIVSIIGPNGAGKSTLLNTILGFLAPKRGSITFSGIQIQGLPTEQVVNLGLTGVPEGAGVFHNMSVRENLLMGAYIKPPGKLRSETMEKILTFFPRLKERINQPGGTLSGGERQMLAIARALMSNPQLLLLDEPSLGLAPLIVNKVFETITELAKQNITIMLVEQNVSLSLEIADRAYVLENGGIVMHGTGRELIGEDYIRKAYLAV